MVMVKILGGFRSRSYLASVLLLLLSLTLVACQKDRSVEIDDDSTQVASTTEATVIEKVRTSTENVYFSDYSNFTIRCNRPTSFRGIDFSAVCPTEDNDKDGYPDTRDVQIELKNNTEHPINLTFAGIVRRLDDSESSFYEYRNGVVFHYSTTIKFNPNDTLILVDRFRNFDEEFAFEVGLGKIRKSQSDTETIPLTCPRQANYEGTTFGVKIKLNCYTGKLDFTNYAASPRGYFIKPSYPDLDITYLNPTLGNAQHLRYESLQLPSKAIIENIEVEITIPR